MVNLRRGENCIYSKPKAIKPSMATLRRMPICAFQMTTTGRREQIKSDSIEYTYSHQLHVERSTHLDLPACTYSTLLRIFGSQQVPDFPSQNVLTGWHSAIKAIKQAPLVKTKPTIKPDRKYLSHLYCFNRSIKNEMEILTKQIIMVERMYMTKAHFMIFSSWSTCKEYWCLPKPAWTSMIITTVSATSNNYFSGRQRWLARNSTTRYSNRRNTDEKVIQS